MTFITRQRPILLAYFVRYSEVDEDNYEQVKSILQVILSSSNYLDVKGNQIDQK